MFDIFSSQPGQTAGQDTIAAINAGQAAARKQYGLGRTDLSNQYAQGLQEWGPVYGTANRGEDAYADAVGLNGPEGDARARAAFLNNPAYNFQLNQGLGAAQAAAQKAGYGASGNDLIDLNNYAQGMASQGWGNYRDALQPFLGQATTAAGARAGIDTGLGTALNASRMGQAGMEYGADIARGKAQAGIDMAPYQASANLWGTGLALAGDVAQAIGGGKGGGMPNYASLFDKFGTSSPTAASGTSLG